MHSYSRLRSAGWAVGLGAVLLASCQTAEIEPAEFDYYSSGVTPAVASTPITLVQESSMVGSDTGQSGVVTVQRGDSLYGLSRRHLGDGNRWREIASLNGLTDSDVRSLAVGSELRIPIR